MADAVLHVEGNWPELECEGETRKASCLRRCLEEHHEAPGGQMLVQVSLSEMEHLKIKQHGTSVMMYDDYPARASCQQMIPCIARLHHF